MLCVCVRVFVIMCGGAWEEQGVYGTGMTTRGRCQFCHDDSDWGRGRTAHGSLCALREIRLSAGDECIGLPSVLFEGIPLTLMVHTNSY